MPEASLYSASPALPSLSTSKGLTFSPSSNPVIIDGVSSFNFPSLPPLSFDGPTPRTHRTPIRVVSPPLPYRSRSNSLTPTPSLLMRRPSLTSTAPPPPLVGSTVRPRSQSFSVYEERVELEERKGKERGRPPPLLPPMNEGPEGSGVREGMWGGGMGESTPLEFLSPIIEHPMTSASSQPHSPNIG